MNRTLSNVLLFAAGAVVGIAATQKYFKTKYERLAQEEIDSVKGRFSYKQEEVKTGVEDDIVERGANVEKDDDTRYWMHYAKPDIRDYVNAIRENGYSEEAREEDVYEPYVISPDSYGEIHEYETISLNYFADGVLTDDLDNPIEDVEGIVGLDFAEHFGEYEDDSVFIRNDERKCDYEILRDIRNYADVMNDTYDPPYPAEDE